MKLKDFNKELFEFINISTCSFTCIDLIKNKLIEKGYVQLFENERWYFENGKYFVIRNDASIIAFNIGKNHKESFNIISAHCDTIGFSIKPKKRNLDRNSKNKKDRYIVCVRWNFIKEEIILFKNSIEGVTGKVGNSPHSAP